MTPAPAAAPESIPAPPPPIEPEPEPEEEEIDALAEMTAAEAIICEERHEELVSELLNLREQLTALQQQQQTIAARVGPENPLLIQIQQDQERIREALGRLMEGLDSRSSTPPRSVESTPEAPAPDSNLPSQPEPESPVPTPESREAAAPKRRVRRI